MPGNGRNYQNSRERRRQWERNRGAPQRPPVQQDEAPDMPPDMGDDEGDEAPVMVDSGLDLDALARDRRHVWFIYHYTVQNPQSGYAEKRATRVNIWYAPSAVNAGVFSQLAQIGVAGNGAFNIKDLGLVDTLASVLSQLIVSWDIKRAGKPVQPTLDVLRGLDLGLLLQLANAVIGETAQGWQTATRQKKK